MRVAEVTADQAAALDPATLLPGQAIAVRFGDLRAVVGPLPSDAPVPTLVGELRHHDDRVVRRPGDGSANVDIIRTAAATPEGLRGLLDALQGLAEGRTVRRARTQPPTKTGAA